VRARGRGGRFGRARPPELGLASKPRPRGRAFNRDRVGGGREQAAAGAAAVQGGAVGAGVGEGALGGARAAAGHDARGRDARPVRPKLGNRCIVRAAHGVPHGQLGAEAGVWVGAGRRCGDRRERVVAVQAFARHERRRRNRDRARLALGAVEQDARGGDRARRGEEAHHAGQAPQQVRALLVLQVDVQAGQGGGEGRRGAVDDGLGTVLFVRHSRLPLSSSPRPFFIPLLSPQCG